MRSTITLGRVVGIPVGVNWSLLLIGALLAFDVHRGLADGGSTGPAVWVAALVFVVAFYAGLVAHEMGHALVARRFGVGTAEITLWMLGGVAKLEGDSPSPRVEGTMALAGPAVSLAVAACWGLIGWSLDAVSGPILLSDVAWWLAVLNVVLAVFNLVPAFPLDGGRVLRSLLWAWRHDRLRGTEAAARVGMVFGSAAVMLGLVDAATTDDTVGGLWLVLLGAFVIHAGRSETAFVRAGVALDRLTAGTICRRPPVLDPTMLVGSMLAGWPLDRDHPTYLVGSPEQPDGFFVYELAEVLTDHPAQSLAVAALPWAAVPAVEASAPIVEVEHVLARSRSRRVRVRLPDGDLGVIGPADIAAAYESVTSRRL